MYDPTWQCFIDDISIGSAPPFPAQENNWVFCQQDTLVDGPHILTVNATVMKKQTFWFDNIEYVPSASVPLDQEAIVVYNLDPQLHYGPGWGSLGGNANATGATGSTFSFDFIGMQIHISIIIVSHTIVTSGVSLTWFGWIPKEFPLGSSPATYSIDGQTPINFLLKGLATNISTLYNQLFFETNQLSPGSHALEVVYQGNNSTPLTYYSLIIQNGTLPSTTTSVTGVSTTAGSGVSSTSTLEKGPPIGAIVGGVIGGLVLIVLAVLVFLLLRWRQKRVTEEKILSSMPEPFNYTPLHPSPDHPLSSSGISHSKVPQPQTTQVLVTSAVTHATNGRTPSGLSTSTSATTHTNLHHVVPLHQSTNPLLPTPLPIPSGPPLSPFTTKTERQADGLGFQRSGDVSPPMVSMSSNDTRSSNVVLQLHEDSGIRMPQNALVPNVVMDVPPLYTPD